MQGLRELARKHDLKFTHIVLDRGATVSQPMLTIHDSGTFARAIARADSLRFTLGKTGLRVNRVKIEAAPWNPEVPQSAEEAASQPPDRYFEHHIKVLLDGDSPLDLLRQEAQNHQAHISRNAFKRRSDGFAERFVTQRCTGVSQAEAQHLLETLRRSIEPLVHTILAIEQEFVVFDSNVCMDAGWIQIGE